MNFLQRTATIAPPGYNRWLVPPAAIALHMCIWQIYGFSVFKKPLAQALGVTAPTAGDWTQPEVGLSFSIALAVLGVSAALFGSWRLRLAGVAPGGGDHFLQLRVRTVDAAGTPSPWLPGPATTARLRDVHIEVMPAPRALRSLMTATHDAVFPALDIFFEPGQPVIRTAETIDCKEDFVFTARGTPLLRSLADLRGKVVGITHGYPYSREVMAANGYTLEVAVSDELNIRKLAAGRIDAFVLDEKTGVKAAEALGLSGAIQYDRLAPVSRQEVYVAFQANERGRELAARTSEALRQMKASGRYQAITHGITFARGCSGR